MNHKMMSAAGCLFLLAAAMVPTVLGHDDNGSRLLDVDAGVAGTFYGPAGYYVAFDGTTQNLPDPVGPVDPDFLSAAGQALCDVEVLGDGTSAQEPDETSVDGVDFDNGVAPEGPNAAPDGTFDDGGNGGACHTNHYDFAAYNTPGCLDDGARASNLAPLAAPWVGASCDWKTVEGGTPQSDILVGCLVNGVLDGVDDQPAEAVACVVAFVECTVSPLTCAQNGVESCGSDSVADGVNFGAGNTRTAYPYSTPVGQSFTDDGVNCHLLNPSTATMVAFMFSGVTVTDGGAVTTNPAVQGDVWQVA